MKNNKKIAFCSVLLLGMPLVAFASSTSEQIQKTVTATGKATVNLPQTQGIVVLGINSTDSDPKDAQESVRRKADKLVTAIHQLHPLNIATTAVSVNPVWTYKDNNSKITGYTANYSLTVTANINQVGTVIDTAVENGVDNIGTPQFSASDKARESAGLVAIKLATQDAKTRADAALGALGIKSGVVKQITIQNSSNPPHPMVRFTAMSATANDKAPATEIEAGNDVVNAEVNIVVSY